MIVHVNQQEFSVEVIQKRSNRKIYLRIRNGVLIITTPIHLSLSKIEDLIQKNFNYIIKHMQVGEKVEDKIHYLGKIYKLTIQQSFTNTIYVLDDEIRISCTNLQEVKRLVETLYKNTLKNVVERYSKEILSKFNISKPVEFQYKSVKGYYGECFSKRNLIILSTRLCKYELKYILSVIYHECAHFKYQNHQREFYEYLEQRYPNYRFVQKELRKIRYNEKY